MAAKFPSGIASRLKTSGYLKYFNAMKDKNLDWDVLSEEYTVEGSDQPIVYMDLPEPKRRKLAIAK